MTRKRLALALVASAFLAAAATASAHTPALFVSELEETVVSSRVDGTTGAEKHHVLIFAGAKWTCPEPSFKGTWKSKSVTELTLDPEYNTGICNYEGAQNATVAMNGCDFVWKANGEFEIGSKAGKNCANEPIKLQNEAFCVIEVGPQTIKTAITYKTIQPITVKEITVDLKPAGILYTQSVFCPGGGGKFATGKYETGRTILKGANTMGAQTNITWEATIP
jgi:hypothetical protein